METVQGVKQSLNWLKNWSVHHQNYPFGWLRMLSFFVFPAYDSLLLLIQIKSLSRWDEILHLIGEKKSHISTKTEKLEVAPIPTDVKSCERLMGAVWQRWGTAGWFSALVWETGICAHLVSNWASCYGETPNSLANSSPLPIGRAYQTLKFFSQEVLVCCDSWQRIPVGKWWTGSGESKVNYEVGEISALQITVQWFHWNGSVWQHIQIHTAGQNTQTLLYGMSCLHGKRGSSPWINEPELGDSERGFSKYVCVRGSHVWVCVNVSVGARNECYALLKPCFFRIPRVISLPQRMPSTVCIVKAPAYPRDSISTSMSTICRGTLAPGNMNR